MKFTLTYEGALNTGAGKKASRKHAIRRVFHRQLQRLWEVNKILSNWHIEAENMQRVPARAYIQSQMPKLGDYNFVPLITDEMRAECALEFHILRSTHSPGGMPDIDNQIKVLCDALKMPRSMSDLTECGGPQESENPFFVLMEDDSLVTKITSVSDELLMPVNGNESIGSSDVKVMIFVYIRPNIPTAQNIIFFADDSTPWDHKYDVGIPDELRHMTNLNLKSVATNCIFRILAMSDNFASWTRGGSMDFGPMSREAWECKTQKMIQDSNLRQNMWLKELQPKAYALQQELLRRIYGEGPYPSDNLSYAIDSRMLSGPSPLTDAATHLEMLIRRLP